jgi:hypothetical protein
VNVSSVLATEIIVGNSRAARAQPARGRGCAKLWLHPGVEAVYGRLSLRSLRSGPRLRSGAGGIALRGKALSALQRRPERASFPLELRGVSGARVDIARTDMRRRERASQIRGPSSLTEQLRDNRVSEGSAGLR